MAYWGTLTFIAFLIAIILTSSSIIYGTRKSGHNANVLKGLAISAAVCFVAAIVFYVVDVRTTPEPSDPFAGKTLSRATPLVRQVTSL